MTKTKVHTVSVTVDKQAIRVEPDTLRMHAKEEVQWTGTNARRFSIVFEGNGPFAAKELPHEVATRRHQPQSKGHFKYAVVSADDPKLRLDPVVIIEDPPTGTDP